MLKPEQQAMFIEDLPEMFIPIAGGWGRMGMTHVILANVSEDVLEGAIRTAYKLRVAANAKSGRKKSLPTKGRERPNRATRKPKKDSERKCLPANPKEEGGLSPAVTQENNKRE
jgi:hypothetical protein